MVKTCLLPQHLLELGVGKRKQELPRSCLNDFSIFFGGTPEQDPMTYYIIPCVLGQSEHLVIKASRERA